MGRRHVFEALVVPLDGSEFAAQAVPVAVAIARAGHVGLRLVGVARDDGERAAVRRYLDGTAREVPTTVVPEVDVILDADPVRALLELAADGTSVLCLASHDRGRVAAKIMHSVGSALVARARQPIVVVGEHVAPSIGANDVVVAVDGVHDPLPLVATAVAWARQLRAPLRIVTVYERTLTDPDQPSHFTRQEGPPVDPDVYLGAIQRGVEEEGMVSVSTTAIADAAGVGEGLVDHLADRPARLLVVGGRRHGGPDRPSGTVRRLLRTAPVPLVVVNQRGG
jgi:nucleotide-binding universal stress UspA family protein